MTRFQDYALHTLADPRFYDPPDRVRTGGDLERELRDCARAGAEIVVHRIWAECWPGQPGGQRWALPAAGWKIHVSARPELALEAVRRVCGEFRREPFAWKCLRDTRFVQLACSRSWPAGQVGKVIAIYARSASDCRALLERLYPALSGIHGPYVLTDKRFRDSGCLSYRYGGFRSAEKVEPDGNRTSVLPGPDGQYYLDDRRPVYRRPPWIPELFPDDPAAGSTPVSGGVPVIGGYRVFAAITHSGAGGVYRAERIRDGMPVVLKEARPHTHIGDDGRDGMDRLRDEYTALQALAGTGVAPQPVELFTEWEHLFLAEEFLEGQSLLEFLAERYPLARGGGDRQVIRAYLADAATVLDGVRGAVDTCHRHGFAYGDVSLRNILVRPETLQVQLVDFESSQPLDAVLGDVPRTLGFRPPPGSAAASDARKADQFGVDTVELALTVPFVQIRALSEPALSRIAQHAATALGHPVSGVLDRLGLPQGDRNRLSLPDTVAEAVRFIEAVHDPGRPDRPFPADPAVFRTSPWSLAHGVAGVVRALYRLTGRVPLSMAGWPDQAWADADRSPPGLLGGHAGVGWVLLETGAIERGMQFVDRALRADPDRLPADVAHGVAGLALTALAGWLHTGQERYRDRAAQLAEVLLRRASTDATTLCWPPLSGPHPIGWAHGSAGIAVALLSVGLATEDEARLADARRALAFDLAQVLPAGQGAPGFPAQVGASGHYPYWRCGSAGVVAAVIRFCRAMPEPELFGVLDALVPILVDGIAMNPGLFEGMTGLIDVALDARHLLGRNDLSAAAAGMVDAVVALGCPQPEGLAFPGDTLLRYSTDFATGSAGIALVLDRVHRAGPAVHLTVDELLPVRGGTSSAESLRRPVGVGGG